MKIRNSSSKFYRQRQFLCLLIFLYCVPVWAEEAVPPPAGEDATTISQTPVDSAEKEVEANKQKTDDEKSSDAVEPGSKKQTGDTDQSKTKSVKAIPSPLEQAKVTEAKPETDDPIIRACADASPGEQRIVEGMTVTCNGAATAGSKAFDFQESKPVDVSSGGFVGFNKKYLNTFYLSIGTGYTNHGSMVSYADLDRINSEYENAGYTATSTASPHGFGIDFSLGYIANEYILIELGYSYLGSINISTTYDDGVDARTDTHNAGMSALNVSVFGRYNLGKIAIFPQAKNINALGLVEALQWSRSNTQMILGIPNSYPESGFGFGLGLGGDYYINEFVTMRAMWKYKTLGNEGVQSIMFTAMFQNNTLYAQAIQDSIVTPLMNLF